MAFIFLAHNDEIMVQRKETMMKKSRMSETATEEQQKLDREIKELVSALERQNQLFSEKIRTLMIGSQKDRCGKNTSDISKQSEKE